MYMLDIYKSSGCNSGEFYTKYSIKIILVSIHSK